MVTKDDFECWVMQMDEAIDEFANDTLPADLANGLDYSLESLDSLEMWLLDVYPDIPSVLQDSEKTVVDGASRYVGEVFRKQLGGIWSIDLVNPKNVYFNIPVVEMKGLWRECPASLVTAAVDRRTGCYISSTLRAISRRSRPS